MVMNLNKKKIICLLMAACCLSGCSSTKEINTKTPEENENGKTVVTMLYTNELTNLEKERCELLDVQKEQNKQCIGK